MITERYITFFKALEKNNNKEWFHANKKLYVNDVKNPFLELLEALIPELQTLEPQISTNAKDALFRINRDIRFSKDKTPYNTLLKAGFALGGKKSILPGYYLGISAETVYVGGGLFNLKGGDLKKVRTLIATNTDQFLKAINSVTFVSTFQKLKGEKAKRLDKTFQAVQIKTPLIANKQFYAMRELPLINYLASENLHSVILESFKTINPLNQFLIKAFK